MCTRNMRAKKGRENRSCENTDSVPTPPPPVLLLLLLLPGCSGGGGNNVGGRGSGSVGRSWARTAGSSASTEP